MHRLDGHRSPYIGFVVNQFSAVHLPEVALTYDLAQGEPRTIDQTFFDRSLLVEKPCQYSLNKSDSNVTEKYA